MKEHDIINEQAQYVSQTHTIDTNFSIPSVAIINKDTNETDIFLQSHEADEFIAQVTALWQRLQTVSYDVVELSVAKPYIDCL